MCTLRRDLILSKHKRKWKMRKKARKIIAWIFIALVPSNVYIWMRVNWDPDVVRPPIPESNLKHHFSSLNKYGNDSSGCPVSQDQFIKVSYKGAGGSKYKNATCLYWPPLPGNRRWQIYVSHNSNILYGISTIHDCLHLVYGGECWAAFSHQEINSASQSKHKWK